MTVLPYPEVSTAAEFNADLQVLADADPGNYTIDLAADLSGSNALDRDLLPVSGAGQLTVNGHGHTIDGGGTFAGIHSGTFTLSDITEQNVTSLGGYMTVAGPGKVVLAPASGAMVAAGWVVIDSGTLELANPAAAISYDVYVHDAGTLQLDFDATMSLAQFTGALDLRYAAPADVRFTYAHHFGTSVDHVFLGPGPGQTLVNLAPDGAGGSLITYAGATACFLEGTVIETSEGGIAVEQLEVGMRLRSAFGGTAPIVWIGSRRIDCRRHPRPEAVWPIRIRLAAFGEAGPRRDLWLSPDHAVFVEDVLIPARCLVNGTTVVQVPMEVVTYYHVELPAHDVVFAEGLPAESYLDTGNRSAFANGGPALDLHPDFAREVWLAQACAPQITHGPIHESIMARLCALARHATPVGKAS